MKDIDIHELANLLREGLANGRQPVLTIDSNSMSPLFKKGDQIILSQTSLSELNAGDIITLECSDFLLTHRFWRKQEDKIITRGDQPLRFDPPALPEQLIGRVTVRIRDQKKLQFDTGIGKWLNKHLIWLTNFENRLVMNDSTDPLLSNGWWKIKVHKVLYIWRQIPVFLVGKLSG